MGLVKQPVRHNGKSVVHYRRASWRMPSTRITACGLDVNRARWTSIKRAVTCPSCIANLGRYEGETYERD